MRSEIMIGSMQKIDKGLPGGIPLLLLSSFVVFFIGAFQNTMNGMLTSASASRVSRYLIHLTQTKSHLAIQRCRQNSTQTSSQPFRSLLYVPASNTRALEKVSTFQGSNQPDAIMLDLEDGVAPTSKDSARENLVKYFQRDDDGSSIFPIVRINSVDSPWFIDDISAVAQLVESDASIAVCLPKIECLDDIEFVSKELRDRCGHGGKDSISNAAEKKASPNSPIPLWPMIETPRAILTSLSISSHPSINGLILGTNDLSKCLNIEIGQGTREGLTTQKANDKVVIDGVYNNFHDGEGLHRECIQGKRWGMEDGKTLIYPSQVQTANEVFAPSDEEVEHARRVIACWEEASKKKDFTGVAVLEGSGMIEELHAKSARTLLGRAEKIAQMGNN